jgi:hypothetical protein
MGTSATAQHDGCRLVSVVLGFEQFHVVSISSYVDLREG